MTCKPGRVLLLSSIFLSGILLSACGKKGPLYLPDHKPVAPASSPAPAQSPVVPPP